MKKLLAFLLVATLILSMGTTVFAVKGGDGELNGAIAFEFNSAEAINDLNFVSGRKLTVDTENANTYDVTARLTVGTQTQAHFYLTEQAVSAFSNSKYNYVNVLINNAQDTAREVQIYILYNANGKATLQPGWNLVTLPKRNLVNADNVTYSTGNSFRMVATSTTAGEYYNVDKIWLTAESPYNYSYAVSSDSAILWQFNSAEAVDDVSIANVKCPTLNVDYNNVNAYNVSATFTTNGVRRMQFKFNDNTIQETDENGNYKYDYLNILVGNLSSDENIGFGCGINSYATAITSIMPGWSVVSVPIDTLFRPSTSSATGKRNEYANVYSSGMSLQMCNDKGGNGTNAISGIVYNFDMIWVSKTPAAVGTADANGTIVSQTPLTCTDAVINSDGTASCKITNWPGERFVVIFATYNADGSLNSVDCVKDYDGGENKETVVNSSKALTVPEGGTTKVMVWNGFGEIAPMTTVK